MFSDAERGSEKVTEIEDGQGRRGPDGRRFEFVVQLEPFADRDVDAVSRFRRYSVAVGFVVVADAQYTISIFTAGTERYDRISQHVVGQGDAFFSLFDDIDDTDGKIALFGHVDQCSELDARHFFCYIDQPGELHSFHIFCGVEQSGKLDSFYVPGRIQQSCELYSFKTAFRIVAQPAEHDALAVVARIIDKSGELHSLEAVGDVAHSRELESFKMPFGTVEQSADHDTPAVFSGTVYHAGELHARVTLPCDVRQSCEDQALAFMADVIGDTCYLYAGSPFGDEAAQSGNDQILFVSRIAYQQVDRCAVRVFGGLCTVRAQWGKQAETESGIGSIVFLGRRLAAYQESERKEE